MKRKFYRAEKDDWAPNGTRILSEESIRIIKDALSRGPIMVQHWYYRGSFPDVFTFPDFLDFQGHIEENTIPGNAFKIWSFADLCKGENMIICGKLHDDDGCVPSGGAY